MNFHKIASSVRNLFSPRAALSETSSPVLAPIIGANFSMTPRLVPRAAAPIRSATVEPISANGGASLAKGLPERHVAAHKRVPGPMAALKSRNAAAQEKNETLRASLSARGIPIPPVPDHVPVAVAGNSYTSWEAANFHPLLESALKQEAQNEAMEIALVGGGSPPAASPAATSTAVPQLTENERIFAVWEMMTGDIKSVYYQSHSHVLDRSRPAALASLTEEQLASAVHFQLTVEGLLPPSASDPAEGIWERFDQLTGAAKQRFYREHEAVLSKPRFQKGSGAPLPATSESPVSSEFAERIGIFAKWDSLSGPAKTAFYRQHEAVLAYPRPQHGSPVPLSAATWKDPAPDLFARWESLTGAAKTQFYRDHEDVLSRPRGYFAQTAA